MAAHIQIPALNPKNATHRKKALLPYNASLNLLINGIDEASSVESTNIKISQ